MSTNRTYLAIATSLLLFSGSANAEHRYFEFTGTVTRTENAAIAPVGSTIHGMFDYDDAMTGDLLYEGAMFYDPGTFLAATVAGHTLVTDRMTVSIHEFPGVAGDLVDIVSTQGMMIDKTFYADGYFGFRLQGDVDGLSLPSTYDLSRFTDAAGAVYLNGGTTVLADFSVDSIVNVAPPCLKKNGKPDKRCKDKGR